MQVAEQCYFALAMHVSDEIFRVEHGWMQQPVRLLPLAVQIAAEQRASVIAKYDTVRIQHGHDANDEVFPQ